MLTLNAQASAAQQLKDRTKENHEAVEAMLVLQIGNMQFTDDYIRLLKSFYGFYLPLEKRIEQFIDPIVLTDIQQRRKAASILDDLHALNAAISHLPLAGALPQINNTAQAMGALYVLEGSTLGGKSIVRMLMQQKSLNLQAQHLRFFNGYGKQTGPMWLSFLAALEGFAGRTGQTEDMIQAANETFLCLKQWFTFQKA